MPLDRDELRRIADLARLELSAAEETLFAAQLARVVEHFAALAGFEADSFEADDVASSAAAATAAATAEDVAGACLPRATVFAVAPRVVGDYFVVPPVLPPRHPEGSR